MIIFPRVYNNYNFFGITENVISRFIVFELVEEGRGVGKEKRIVIRILLRNQYYIKYINLWLDTKPLSLMIEHMIGIL